MEEGASETAAGGRMEPPQRFRRARAWGRATGLFAAGVVAAFAAVWLYGVVRPGPAPLTSRDISDTVAKVMASATPPPPNAVRVYQAIAPSLVLIETQGQGSGDSAGNSLGSGVIVDDSGDILTSLHVVTNSTAITLTFADGTESPGKISVQQPENDIAVVRADQPPAQVVPATLGNPNQMRVGDEAFVVGNPFGLYSSLSAGVISGFGRSFDPGKGHPRLTGLIQIDAAVNPGNSGGPLLNQAGEVVGIVEGIVNPTEQDVFIGIGFAVPITTAGGAIGSPVY
jgi:S1-C subfamily serine protease